VGFELARSLSLQHDVTIIDKNADALERLQVIIDIYPVVGDIKNPETYRTLVDKTADIFIAVTDSDEANILSTLIVNDNIDVKQKIIRLKNSYFSQSKFLTSMGDIEQIYPFQLAAQNIKMLLSHPEANNVKKIRESKLRLVSTKVDNPNYEEKQVSLFENGTLKIVAIERSKELIIPRKEEIIQHGDVVYFYGNTDTLNKFYGELDLQMPKKISNAVVFGARLLGIEIAKVLIAEGINVKIVEKDMAYCKIASEILQDSALIINSHYDENILYNEENLDSADMIISTSNQDELNIVRSIQAQEHNIPKVIAINNEQRYYSMMHKLGIVVARGPRTSAYYSILESLSTHGTIGVKHFCGGAGIIFDRIIERDSKLAKKKIHTYDNRNGLLIIERNDYIIHVTDDIVIEEGDMIILIVSSIDEKRAKQWIASL